MQHNDIMLENKKKKKTKQTKPVEKIFYSLIKYKFAQASGCELPINFLQNIQIALMAGDHQPPNISQNFHRKISESSGIKHNEIPLK